MQDIQQAGLDAVARFFTAERNRANPPDAIFFYDDYLAAGGLIALAATGLRAPEDIRVATLTNKGLGPVWFKPLTRLEYDPTDIHQSSKSFHPQHCGFQGTPHNAFTAAQCRYPAKQTPLE